MSTNQTKPEGKWQTVLISGMFAVLMTIAGWLYTGLTARQEKYESDMAVKAEMDNRQNERTAVQENETKNLRDSIDRLERKIDLMDQKLDRALPPRR